MAVQQTVLAQVAHADYQVHHIAAGEGYEDDLYLNRRAGDARKFDFFLKKFKNKSFVKKRFGEFFVIEP